MINAHLAILTTIAQFPGWRNWGYDGAYLFAPQSTCGGPDGLKRLVDARTRLDNSLRGPSLDASGGKTHGHKVWVYDGDDVFVIHRWASEGLGALLILGFNTSRVTISLREPEGVWQLSIDSGAKEFGGTGQDSIQPSLAVSPQDTQVKIPTYTAAVFIFSSPAQPWCAKTHLFPHFVLASLRSSTNRRDSWRSESLEGLFRSPRSTVRANSSTKCGGYFLRF